jgi:hypothetical protein
MGVDHIVKKQIDNILTPLVCELTYSMTRLLLVIRRLDLTGLGKDAWP